ncbi:hypothetical protein CIK86_18205 [Pseudoalteromonas sp. JB197]|nr:hypothetical protein CIK86_18205 [Pseudoalteromonas sp. JB197]
MSPISDSCNVYYLNIILFKIFVLNEVMQRLKIKCKVYCLLCFTLALVFSTALANAKYAYYSLKPSRVVLAV